MSVPGQYSWLSTPGAPRLFLRALSCAALVCAGLLIHAQQAPAAPPIDRVNTNLIPLLLGLLLASGLISASETSLFSLDKLDATQLRGSRWFTARLIVQLLDRPNDTLITILILNNFVNLAITLTVAALSDQLLRGEQAEAFTLAAVAATLSILLVGEILPKMLAHTQPRRVAGVLSPPLAAASWILWPAIRLINLVLGGLYRFFRIPETGNLDEVSEEELKVMISSGEVSSVLEEDELEMIDGVFELRHTTIDEILTPRVSVDAVPDDLDQQQMLARLRAFANSRALVYRETLDDLKGFLLVKQVLLEPEKPWTDHLREPLMVPEKMRLLDLLKLFRRQRKKMAVAVDEYGGVAGIVTLQDLLEEIVGDIYEKHEQQEVAIQPIGAGRWLVNGSVDLEEAAEALRVTFPSRQGRTLGGFMMNTLGRIPHTGDEITYESLHLRVREMIGRRVHSLEVSRVTAPPAPESPIEEAPAP